MEQFMFHGDDQPTWKAIGEIIYALKMADIHSGTCPVGIQARNNRHSLGMYYMNDNPCDCWVENFTELPPGVKFHVN